MIELALLAVGVALMFYGIYKWGVANNEYFARQNLPFMKPTFLVGNSGGFFAKKYSINDFVQYLYSSFPNAK